jgi:hypothetical protein
MADPVCAGCSKPILSTDNQSTVQQVDACTMAVEHLTYHSACFVSAKTKNVPAEHAGE